MRILLAGLALLASCSKPPAPAPEEATVGAPASAAQDSKATVPPRLERLWIAEGFSAPEGVALAPDGAYFISNVAGEGEAKDGIGWIAKLSPEGDVIAEKFIEGLDAPKGMAVKDGVLYVADIDRVRSFDASTGAPQADISIDGARFLNDATVWKGEVYVSDSDAARIWRLGAEGPVVWREGEELAGVNGLLGVGDRLYVSTMSGGYLFEATAAGGWREIASGMIDADGIGLVPGGGFLVSSWPGEIHYVADDGAVSSLLNTRDAGVLQNDLTMFADIVIVPNWMPGTVTAWRIVAAP
ncbi:MAG: hypothetical protein HXY21_09875 [Parvularculaceae bacterium]|nr:hypothetical protein [Parvularculaceae bacterium]